MDNGYQRVKGKERVLACCSTAQRFLFKTIKLFTNQQNRDSQMPQIWGNDSKMINIL